MAAVRERSVAAIRWDATAEAMLATCIDAHLRRFPPPPDSAIADDLREYAEHLACDSRAREADLVGVRQLRVARATVA